MNKRRAFGEAGQRCPGAVGVDWPQWEGEQGADPTGEGHTAPLSSGALRVSVFGGVSNSAPLSDPLFHLIINYSH